MDRSFANQVKYHNSLFSAFKSNNQTTTLRHLKVASKAKSFTDFKNAAMTVTNDYNKTWLKSEYRAAKSRIRGAKMFRQAQDDADLYPNIKYLPSVAADPREEHKQFYYVVRPLNDPFWNTHLPPSTWGCQCQWTTTDERVTGMPDDIPSPDPGFDINTGKAGRVFSQSHPYFDVKDKENIIKHNILTLNSRAAHELTYFYADKKTGGCCYSFDNLKNEFTTNTRIGKIYARSGNDVEILGMHYIDSRINGIWHEFKTIKATTVNAVDKAVQRANRQYRLHKLQGNLSLELTEIDKGALLDALKDRFQRMGSKNKIGKIDFIFKNKYIGSATSEDIMKGKLSF